MERLYDYSVLKRQIEEYCKLNEIDDVEEFTNKCTLQGFNIVKFGFSPKDNINRENNGIKEIKGNGRQDIVREKEGKHVNETNREGIEKSSTKEKEKKERIKVRKIKVIKKD